MYFKRDRQWQPEAWIIGAHLPNHPLMHRGESRPVVSLGHCGAAALSECVMLRCALLRPLLR